MKDETASTKNATQSQASTTELTSRIAAAYLSNNPATTADIAHIIRSVHRALSDAESVAPTPVEEKLIPAVPIKRSITPDYLVCLEDGKQLKMLKRYLRSAFNMTPEEYRARWGLPLTYPMVAPNYAAQRSAAAKSIGLGRKTSEALQEVVPNKSPVGQPRKSAG